MEGNEKELTYLALSATIGVSTRLTRRPARLTSVS